MMADTYLRRGRRKLRCFLEKPGVLPCLWAGAYAGGGFFLSAAGLLGTFQPIAMGFCAALSGWQAIAMTLGAMGGYRFFWGPAGIQGTLWAAAGGMLALLLDRTKKLREDSLLPAAVCGAVTAGLGLFYQLIYGESPGLLLYFIRIFTAAGAAALACQLRRSRDAFTDWLFCGVLTLSLGQVMPLPYVSLGFLAAGCLSMTGSFPGAAMAGLGLDLAGITELPMTAVMSAAYFLGLIPFSRRSLRGLCPAGACLLISILCGIRDPLPLPGLLLGGGTALILPLKKRSVYRRGPTGAAQVRLELSSSVMSGMQQIFLEQSEPAMDLEALLEKARLRACSRCPCRKECSERNHLKVSMLKNPLSAKCRKTGRLVTELQRSQEQMRVMKLQRHKRQEIRTAMIQQYGFLSRYLQYLADQLAHRGDRREPSFCVQVSARSHCRERANGDCCLAFSGVGCRYYVLLCDGMGTGMGAAEEGRNAGNLIKQMLKSGFPPEYVLQNLNSILVLRGQAGAVTVDLTEVQLDTGKAVLYKWGAAPSFLLKAGRAEKIGTATPPPGISVEETREAVKRLSLSRGEVLILLSDGVDGEAAVSALNWKCDISTGELADQVLENGCRTSDDDATAAVLRLRPASLVT